MFFTPKHRVFSSILSSLPSQRVLTKLNYILVTKLSVISQPKGSTLTELLDRANILKQVYTQNLLYLTAINPKEAKENLLSKALERRN